MIKKRKKKKKVAPTKAMMRKRRRMRILQKQTLTRIKIPMMMAIPKTKTQKTKRRPRKNHDAWFVHSLFFCLFSLFNLLFFFFIFGLNRKTWIRVRLLCQKWRDTGNTYKNGSWTLSRISIWRNYWRCNITMYTKKKNTCTAKRTNYNPLSDPTR